MSLAMLWPLDVPEGIDTPHYTTPDHCPGCRHSPSPWCAACGALAAVFLPCGEQDEHAMPLCQRCYALVRKSRAQGETARASVAAGRAARVARGVGLAHPQRHKRKGAA